MTITLDSVADIPTDETTVLFIGESHVEDVWPEASAILKEYQPDAIFVESNYHRSDAIWTFLDSYAELEKDVIREAFDTGTRPAGLREEASEGRPPTTPFGTASAYAYIHDLPIYAFDWEEHDPTSLDNMLRHFNSNIKPDIPTDGEFFQGFCDTAQQLLSEEHYLQIEESLTDLNLTESYDEYWIRPLACIAGMSIRNEYMALSINAALETKQYKRILVINGGNHLRQSHTLDQIALQEKVNLQHVYVINGIDSDLEKQEANKPLYLPWEQLDCMQTLVQLGIL